MAITIREGRPEDAAALAELAARTFSEAFSAENLPEDMALHLSRSYGLAQQTAELADPRMTSLMAEVEGTLAGYAQLRDGKRPPCVTGPAPLELLRFYVDRPWQGRGVAQALMQAVIDAAQQRGAATLWLGVWERNERAKAFYRKCGFVDVGSQPFVLGNDQQTDRVMVRRLASTGESGEGGPTIRRATPADAGALARLRYDFRAELGTATETADDFLERCRRWMAARLSAGSPWRCWLAEADSGQGPVGMIWLQLLEKIPNPVGEPELHGYVTSFFVTEPWRRAGVGSRLLALALADCEAERLDAVFLWPTPASRSLYLRHGFACRDDLLVRRAG